MGFSPEGVSLTDLTINSSHRFLRPQSLPILFFEHTAETAEFSSALQEFTTIHTDDFAIDVARPIADKKRGKISQLFHGAEAMHRIAFERHRFQFRPRQHTRKRAL